MANITASLILMFLKLAVSTYIRFELKETAFFSRVLVFSVEVLDEICLSSLKLLIFTINGVPEQTNDAKNLTQNYNK